ncbi:MAG: serine/threonine-protein kinase [Gemmataceae bacterium]
MVDERNNDLDSYVEAFEQARRNGPIENLRMFAPTQDHTLHLLVLRELIRVDLETSWDEQAPTSLSEYRKRYPEVFREPSASEIAYEEFRLRYQHGQAPNPIEYVNAGYNVSAWSIPIQTNTPATESTIPFPASTTGSTGGFSTSSAEGAYFEALGFETDSAQELQKRLHHRLRYIAWGCTAVLAYFSLLVALNPQRKVGFSLESWFLVVFNWSACLVCGLISTALWLRRTWSLGQLRWFELALFGCTWLEMSLDLFSDLFLDRELREAFTQGEHQLFHYGSSWSLPFVFLILSYGTLVPSSWRRCTRVVTAMSVLPLAIAFAGGLWESRLDRTYVESFLGQMSLWLAGACAIAIYGTRRVELLQREVSAARRLGQYRLKERIATGGMGEVYLAEHVLLRRPCALKLIRPEYANDPEARRRFDYEVQVTATLSHPNTVQVFDYGRTRDGTFYYVMEYLPGATLDQIVRQEGSLPPMRVIHLVQQIGGSLREAHSVGLIHRDLKPRNVIVSNRGGVPDMAKLLDFGLVLGHKLPLEKTTEGTIVGSPLFMSPEQAAGLTEIDSRTDIYSLGALTYFLLTGQPPFARATVSQILAAHRNDPPIPPSQLRPDMPHDLETVVLRCLEKDPSARFQTMDELLHALAACHFSSGI